MTDEATNRNASLKPFQNIGNVMLATVVMVIIAISWLGLFDQYADTNLTESITNSAIIYGIARGINAAVSLLQSTQVSAVVMSVSVGELLDPINDLIERFSEVMTFAIVSLSMQQILLLILKSNVFNVLLTVSGLALLFQVFSKGPYIGTLFKLFLTMTLVRLSLALVLALNVVVDHAFIGVEIEKGQRQMKTMSGQVEDFKRQMKEEQERQGLSDLKLISERIKSLESEKAVRKQEAELLQSQIKEQNKVVDESNGQLSWLSRAIQIVTFGSGPEGKKLESMQEQLNRVDANIEAINDQLGDSKAQLECARKRASGKPCSKFEALKAMVSLASLKSQVDLFSNQVKDGIKNILKLLALIILKSMLLPLLFWFALLKVAKMIWNHDWRFIQHQAPSLTVKT